MSKRKNAVLAAEIVARRKFLLTVVPFVADLVQAEGKSIGSYKQRDAADQWVMRTEWRGELLKTSAGLSFVLELKDDGLTQLILKIYDGDECTPKSLVLEVDWPRETILSPYGNYQYPLGTCEVKRFRRSGNWQERLWQFARSSSPLEQKHTLKMPHLLGGWARRLRIRISD